MGPLETEALYREHGASVAALCRSLLRDRAEAEDAAQQVFLSAHRALLNGTTPREPLAWLLAVARHECYARFRQRATAPVSAGDVPDAAAPDVSVHVLRAGELATVWDEVGQMPAAQREAFLLREVRGLSYGQLADELSLSPPSVRSLLLRARTRLRHRLGDVAASFGGAPWIQALVRLAGGGDGMSPVPAATKAAAVGIGALALVGGGDVALTPHHHARPPARSAEHRRAQAHPRHVVEPTTVAVTPPGDRPGFEDRSSERDRSRVSGESGSRRGSDDRGSSSPSSSGESSSGSSDDRGGATTVVAQATTDGRESHDGGRSTSVSTGSNGGSGSSGSSGSDSSHGGSSDGGSDGGPDGGSNSGHGG
ncbi:MAG TPA: sigma-70 family RNA polymerase sigma factor [Gaiellaceae bacterium]|nr:sigma-70 family RNA polymerase sigma factor [Gaiellaceae bacterium]